MLRTIDELLNNITMYRLVLYGLAGLAAIGITFGFIGRLALPAWAMATSLGLLLATCYSANRLLSGVWKAASNSESSLITALILFCILPPATTLPRAMAIVAAGLIAISSKYLLAWRAQHIFNPAAVAAVIIGLIGVMPVTWWIGGRAMLPFTMLLGVLILRKIRRFRLFFSLTVASLAVLLIIGLQHGQAADAIIAGAFTSWPLVFFGTIMLTEPATMPPRNALRLLYGALVGALFASQLHVGIISATPQVALVIGNIFAFAVSLRRKVFFTLKERRRLSPTTYDFSFTPNRPLKFLPGQYMEWTLPHAHTDGRGNRRTFTIASSPAEKDIHIGVKVYEPSSSFKRALLAMQPGDSIIGSQLAGDFTLPYNQHQKLVFIAGGVGITPFRSMLTYLLDSGNMRDIVLFYLVSNPKEILYTDDFEQAAKQGVRIFAPDGGVLTLEDIANEVGDYRQRTFYISGPPAMVTSYRHALRGAGILPSHIVTDYFSGY